MRTSYHHGALREGLITACVALIENEGIGAVSLRRVAREAGVSPGAPYHHFADRSALLTAISVRKTIPRPKPLARQRSGYSPRPWRTASAKGLSRPATRALSRR
jgi:AcrR family transcriptional regulator